MRVCYFGGYDAGHIRNRMMVDGLREHEVEVLECHSRHPLMPARICLLILRYLRFALKSDLVIVGACGHYYVPLAWMLTRFGSKPLVFDAFVSLYEIWQEEHLKPNPFQRLLGGVSYFAERLAARLSDLFLLDTPEHVDYFRHTFPDSADKVRFVTVGSIDPSPGPKQNKRSLKVFWAGTFRPWQGIDIILKAASLLSSDSAIQFDLMGNAPGSLKQTLKRNSNVQLSPESPGTDYYRQLVDADIALGVFTARPKAGRVIPCKVYDALAAGTPLITANTPAVRRLLKDKENALLIPCEDPQALAEAILQLKEDPSLRRKLSQEARKKYEQVGTPKVVGKELLTLCQLLLERRK